MSAIILLPVVLFGLGLLIAGNRIAHAGRTARAGTVPHCRACNYNLTGSSMTLCPECGARLGSEVVAVGELQRKPVMIALGLVLFCLGVLVLLLAMVPLVFMVLPGDRDL